MNSRLPGVKSVVFTKRIIAYNLTFAPLGDKKKTPEKQMKPYAVTWHEAKGKRSAPAIASGNKFFIAYHRDVLTSYFGLIIVQPKIRIGTYLPC